MKGTNGSGNTKKDNCIEDKETNLAKKTGQKEIAMWVHSVLTQELNTTDTWYV